MGKKLLDLFVFSNLFIAGCAVVMATQPTLFLLRTGNNAYFLWFVFFSTICSYSFHWFLTGPSVEPSHRSAWLEKSRIVHTVFFIIGLVGAIVFFFYLLPFWKWLAIAAIMTFLYSAPKIPHPWFRALRKVALGKTIFLAGVWTHVTSVLPIIIAGRDWTIPDSLFVTGRFFLIYAICILFDYRDRADDKANGVRSLITYFGDSSITWLFFGSLGIFFAASLALLYYSYALAPVLVLILPGIITACLYNYARKNFSDYLYYFVLDGLMALSSLIMLVARI